MTTLTLSETIINARRERGLMQKEIASLLGMKRTTYAKKEIDEGFTEDQLKKVAKLLHLDYKKLQQAKKGFLLHDLKADNIIISNSKSNNKKNSQKEFVTEEPTKVILEKTLLNEAYVRVILRGVASLLAASQKKRVDLVLEELQQAVTAEYFANAKG